MLYKDFFRGLSVSLLLVAMLTFSFVGCTMFGKQRAINLGLSGRVAIFPVAVGVNEAAKGAMEPILFEILNSGFQKALPVSEVQKIIGGDAEVKGVYEKYYSLLSVLHFSDGKMSARLGEALDCEYFLFVFVDEWGYYKEGQLEHAKVFLKMIMVEATTGKIVWQESRLERQKGLLTRPLLKDVAKGLAVEMLKDKKQKR